MRTVAAIPAVGVLAGAAFGLLVPDLPYSPSYIFLIVCGALSVWAWRLAGARVLAAVVVAGFFTGGAMLATDAWQRAWRPTLWTVFEELARAGRTQAEAEGRRLPEDDEASATVTGTLRADAAKTESGASLSVQVDGQAGQEDASRLSRPSRPLQGGIVVAVTGSLAADRLNDWRAGRRVRLPVTLHRRRGTSTPVCPTTSARWRDAGRGWSGR